MPRWERQGEEEAEISSGGLKPGQNSDTLKLLATPTESTDLDYRATFGLSVFTAKPSLSHNIQTLSLL